MIESYKKALKEHYEIEKEGLHINSLLTPTPAGLRDLFIYRMEESNVVSDRNTFERFLGFSYEKNVVNKIKGEIDKFRPLVNFLKEKSDLSDISRLEVLAVILDYPNRPFKKFSNVQNKPLEVKNDKLVEELDNSYSNLIENFSEDDKVLDQKEIVNENIFTDEILNHQGKREKVVVISEDGSIKNQKNVPLKKIGIIGVAVIIIGISIFLNIKNYTTKDCMVWKGEKYEAIDCRETINGFVDVTLPKDDKLIKEFRKIKVDSKTSFFDKKGNPKIWYIKNPNGILEFFNQPGLQPETGKTLKPISKYIIQEYVINENK